MNWKAVSRIAQGAFFHGDITCARAARRAWERQIIKISQDESLPGPEAVPLGCPSEITLSGHRPASPGSRRYKAEFQALYVFV